MMAISGAGEYNLLILSNLSLTTTSRCHPVPIKSGRKLMAEGSKQDGLKSCSMRAATESGKLGLDSLHAVY